MPAQKSKTRWEQFAKEKGIKKVRKNGLVFDEVDKNWKLRYGARSIKKAQDERDFMIEHKAGSDPMINPFDEKVQAKKLRVAKQRLQEVHNKVETAGYRLGAAGRHKTKSKKLRKK